MKEVKRLYFSKLILLTIRKQSVVYFLLMFSLKSGYFSGAFKTTPIVTQTDFDTCFMKTKKVFQRRSFREFDVVVLVEKYI